ncbi:MAG: hypothetical protein V7L05_24750 [Nostoc sp.]
MGSGEWGDEGDEGDGGDEPMPNAQCPMPNSQLLENHTFKDGLQSR